MPRWHFPLRYSEWWVWFKKRKIENNDKKKELECLDDTSPVETEDDMCDKKDNSENNDKEK